MPHTTEIATPSHPLTEVERKALRADVDAMLAVMRDEALAASQASRVEP